jgi:hypothetical protein
LLIRVAAAILSNKSIVVATSLSYDAVAAAAARLRSIADEYAFQSRWGNGGWTKAGASSSDGCECEYDVVDRDDDASVAIRDRVRVQHPGKGMHRIDRMGDRTMSAATTPSRLSSP